MRLSIVDFGSFQLVLVGGFSRIDCRVGYAVSEIEIFFDGVEMFSQWGVVACT